METTRVGIAVVEHAGRFLVGVRQSDQVLAGKAEFPGGKCEPGETARDCAIRECREETGIPVVAERLLNQTEHEYAHGRVALEFWLCRVAIDGLEHDAVPGVPENGFRWAERNELARMEFPDANRQVLDRLAGESSG